MSVSRNVARALAALGIGLISWGGSKFSSMPAVSPSNPEYDAIITQEQNEGLEGLREICGGALSLFVAAVAAFPDPDVRRRKTAGTTQEDLATET